MAWSAPPTATGSPVTDCQPPEPADVTGDSDGAPDEAADGADAEGDTVADAATVGEIVAAGLPAHAAVRIPTTAIKAPALPA